MGEDEFWRSTLREIMALIRVHNEVNDPKRKKKRPMAFIDQVL